MNKCNTFKGTGVTESMVWAVYQEPKQPLPWPVVNPSQTKSPPAKPGSTWTNEIECHICLNMALTYESVCRIGKENL